MMCSFSMKIFNAFDAEGTENAEEKRDVDFSVPLGVETLFKMSG